MWVYLRQHLFSWFLNGSGDENAEPPFPITIGFARGSHLKGILVKRNVVWEVDRSKNFRFRFFFFAIISTEMSIQLKKRLEGSSLRNLTTIWFRFQPRNSNKGNCSLHLRNNSSHLSCWIECIAILFRNDAIAMLCLSTPSDNCVLIISRRNGLWWNKRLMFSHTFSWNINCPGQHLFNSFSILHLEDVLLKDIGGLRALLVSKFRHPNVYILEVLKISPVRKDGRWPFVVDPSGRTSTFIKYTGAAVSRIKGGWVCWHEKMSFFLNIWSDVSLFLPGTFWMDVCFLQNSIGKNCTKGSCFESIAGVHHRGIAGACTGHHIAGGWWGIHVCDEWQWLSQPLPNSGDTPQRSPFPWLLFNFFQWSSRILLKYLDSR